MGEKMYRVEVKFEKSKQRYEIRADSYDVLHYGRVLAVTIGKTVHCIPICNLMFYTVEEIEG